MYVHVHVVVLTGWRSLLKAAAGQRRLLSGGLTEHRLSLLLLLLCHLVDPCLRVSRRVVGGRNMSMATGELSRVVVCYLRVGAEVVRVSHPSHGAIRYRVVVVVVVMVVVGWRRIVTKCGRFSKQYRVVWRLYSSIVRSGPLVDRSKLTGTVDHPH